MGLSASRSKWILLGGFLALAPAMYGQSPPNVIYIMCDDMGYGDLGCYGQPFVDTPHIDRMAQEGMRFTQAYAGSPVSAPSRACLMTGQHSGHTEVRGNKEYWRNAPLVQYGVVQEYSVTGQHPYDPGRVILPEIFKANGYATGMFGKWAGGYEGSVSTPDKRGVDEFYGYICQYMAHLYFPNFLNRYSRSKGDTGVVREVLEENVRYPMSGKDYFQRTQYSADLIHQAALEWLDARKPDEPFFGLFTYTLPHAELVQPQDSLLLGYEKRFFHDKTWGGRDRYNESVHTHAQFAAMISRLDAYVGEILAKLKEKGLDENTLVIFTSDNGPHEEGGADPEFFGRDGKLRGLKRQCYEGGIRIPFIVRWPSHVPAGTENDHQLAFYDLMPTFCDLLGVACPETDGLSFYPTMLGREGQAEHPFLYWEFHETDQIGLRMGDWKLVVVKGVPRLYDLSKDIHEDHDVAERYPHLVEKMVGIIRAQHEDSPLFPVTMPILTEAAAASDPMDKLVDATLRQSLSALERAVGEVKDSLAYPTYATRDDLKWRVGTTRNWVSGFWPGCLWYASALSGDARFEQWARRWTSGIEQEKYNTATHDLGFRFMCTYGNAIRFAPERYTASYTPIVLTAAETLAKRYHPEFSALSSNWDEKTAPPGTTPCVIDIMMNLELLFWAAEHGGDRNYKQLCLNHANTTWRDFRREDGGTYHVVRYDKETGAVVDKNQLQGDVKESTWSRGHAWLVYGLVVCYRYSGDPVWLDRAKLAADYFIRNLNPDGIANWDFQSDVAYTDASASAIVCSALYELVSFLPEGRERDYYRSQADRMLSTLCSPAYFCGDSSPCLLAHSVRYYHKKDGNSQDPNIDEPCVFADYYFLEALYRYKNLRD